MTDSECYIDSLSKDEEWIMLIVLITAILYTFTPCIILLPCLYCRRNCKPVIFSKLQMCYNYVIFSLCGIITISFLVIVSWLTFGVILLNFENQQEVWILVIAIEICLLMSFIDLFFFAIYGYAMEPFKNIAKVVCHCCYRGSSENEREKQPYLERYHTHSLTDNKDR